MALIGKVAQLQAGGRHRGSAWLIDLQHALTALHCVKGEDGIQRTDVTLKFHGLGEAIPAEVLSTSSELDVALLKLSEPALDLAPNVIALSRRGGEHDNVCLIRGHPGLTRSNDPDGILVQGKILNPRETRRTEDGVSESKVIVIHDLSIRATSGGTTQLQGLSGGPVVLGPVQDDAAVNEAAALGLVIAEGAAGNYLHAVAITEIANRFEIVKAALENSPHVNFIDKRLCIDIRQDDRDIHWSAVINPDQAGDLWDSSSRPITELHCCPSLRQLGRAGKALIRLAAYAGLDFIAVPEALLWNQTVNGLSLDGRRPDASAFTRDITDPSISQVALAPAQWMSFSRDGLANRIHQSLNLKLISILSDRLCRFLEYNEDAQVGCSIESSLKSSMWSIWEGQWEPALRGDSELLQLFLIRVFSIDASSTTTDDALMSIGACHATHEQLFLATLYALALSAAGVSTEPRHHDFGNLLINNETGHTCGIKTNNSQRLSLIVATTDWKTEVVILPHLENALLELYEKAVPMTRPDGSLGSGLEKLPPVAISADNDFLLALQGGAETVLAYYNARVAEVCHLKSKMHVPSRTEKLNA